MTRDAPAARIRLIIEAIPGLQILRQELARLPQRGKNYESRRRALSATIRELRESLPGRELKRIADRWPYILLAISIIGLALKIYRGTF